MIQKYLLSQFLPVLYNLKVQVELEKYKFRFGLVKIISYPKVKICQKLKIKYLIKSTNIKIFLKDINDDDVRYHVF